VTDTELKTLLIAYEDPQHVDQATFNVHKARKFFPVPAAIADAKKRGLLIEMPESKPIVNSDSVYQCYAVLTDAGRMFCGLPPMVSRPQPKKPARSLFE